MADSAERCATILLGPAGGESTSPSTRATFTNPRLEARSSSSVRVEMTNRRGATRPRGRSPPPTINAIAAERYRCSSCSSPVNRSPIRFATCGAAMTTSAPTASQASTYQGKRLYGAAVPETFL